MQFASIHYILWTVIVFVNGLTKLSTQQQEPSEDTRNKQYFQSAASTQSIYPELCPIKSTMTTLDKEDHKECLLEQKWHELSGFSKHRRAHYNLTGRFTKRPEGKSIFAYDCLHDSRRHHRMREYPDNCYAKNNSKEMFYQWWYYYGPDISYTFDFILWNHEKFAKDNGFWYLTLYLKHLVTFTDNPANIATLPFYYKRMTNTESKIQEFVNRKKMYDSKRDKMIKNINDITEVISQTMSKFKTDAFNLGNKTNKIIEDVNKYETNRKFIEDKIKEIGKQAYSTRQKFSSFAEENSHFLASSWNHNIQPGGPGQVRHVLKQSDNEDSPEYAVHEYHTGGLEFHIESSNEEKQKPPTLPPLKWHPMYQYLGLKRLVPPGHIYTKSVNYPETTIVSEDKLKQFGMGG